MAIKSRASHWVYHHFGDGDFFVFGIVLTITTQKEMQQRHDNK